MSAALPNGLSPRPVTDDTGAVIALQRRPRVRLLPCLQLPQPCWVVLGRSGQMLWPHSYPSVLMVNGVRAPAHRWAWAKANEREVPDGMVVHHRCFRNTCVNPAHLQAVSFGRNSQLGRWPEEVAA